MSTDNKGKDKKTLLGSLGLLGVVAVKFKFYILAAWKALAFLKLSWLLSPLISIGFYAMLWGWPFAFAIMLLLIIHEMGHWVWMKALGLEPKPIVFLPGVGAYVAMTKLPPDEATHAWVALAGPLVGGVGSAVLYWLGVNSGDDWLIAAGSTGFFLNLLQLVPAKPLDGGFVIHAVSKWFLIPGTVLLVVLALSFHSFLLLIIAGFSVFSLVQQFRQSKQPQLPPEFKRTVVLGADGKLVSVDKAAINPAPALMQQVEPGRYSDQSNENANPNAYANPNPNPNPNPNLIQTTDRDMNADSNLNPTPLPIYSANSIVAAARAGLPVMKPAPLAQRITIAVAYLSLVVMLSYLYWLSHNELISVMPRH